MKVKSTVALALLTAALGTAASAQQPAAGGAVLASEPGKAAVVGTVEAAAQVVALDKTARMLSLKGPKGNVFDVVAGEEVKNFDQIKVGDSVVVRYLEALTLELKKTKVAAGDVVVKEEVSKAKPGERPAVVGGRQISAIASVTAVDPKQSTISLKGPRGNVFVLNVRNPDQFKVVKVGDQVEVTYTEAVALSVEAAAKAPAKKP